MPKSASTNTRMVAQSVTAWNLVASAAARQGPTSHHARRSRAKSASNGKTGTSPSDWPQSALSEMTAGLKRYTTAAQAAFDRPTHRAASRKTSQAVAMSARNAVAFIETYRRSARLSSGHAARARPTTQKSVTLPGG